MPEPKSAMLVKPFSLNLSACMAATWSLVACSKPASVKSRFLAKSPNFVFALVLSLAWVMTSVTNSAG